jgi:hypothetical protein
MDKEIVKAVKGALKQWQDALQKQKEEMAKALDEGRFAHWVEWKSMALVRAEKGVGLWEVILKRVQKEYADGKDDDAVLGVLKFLRNHFVEQILSGTQANKSTNPIANAIRDEAADVLRAVAGTNLLDRNSLAEILTENGIDI